MKIFVKLHMRFFHKLPPNSEFATYFLLVLFMFARQSYFFWEVRIENLCELAFDSVFVIINEDFFTNFHLIPSLLLVKVVKKISYRS